MSQNYRLVVSCPDSSGIIAAVSEFIAENHGNMVEANHYTDASSNRLFMRIVIAANSLPFDLEGFKEVFAPIAQRYSMEWRITDTSKKPKVVLMVSKEAHCLRDLLYRWHCGDMEYDIAAVISNHKLGKQPTI